MIGCLHLYQSSYFWKICFVLSYLLYIPTSVNEFNDWTWKIYFRLLLLIIGEILKPFVIVMSFPSIVVIIIHNIKLAFSRPFLPKRIALQIYCAPELFLLPIPIGYFIFILNTYNYSTDVIFGILCKRS